LEQITPIAYFAILRVARTGWKKRFRFSPNLVNNLLEKENDGKRKVMTSFEQLYTQY
jgi:hypothetical protein